jgi:type VI protein secretion system component VasF
MTERWPDERLDDLKNTIDALTALPVEVAKLSMRIEALHTDLTSLRNECHDISQRLDGREKDDRDFRRRVALGLLATITALLAAAIPVFGGHL